MSYSFYPATSRRWNDLVDLFGARGACGGCWCMFWRLTRSEFERKKGPQNKRALHRIINAGQVPGIIAYDQGKPVGWCSVAPRPEFSALERSRILMPVDDRPVWSVVCFFVAKGYRRKGLTVELLKAAVEYAARKGATILEGYPVDTGKSQPDPFVYTGLASAFRAAGFVEVARRSKSRPVMRFVVKEK